MHFSGICGVACWPLKTKDLAPVPETAAGWTGTDSSDEPVMPTVTFRAQGLQGLLPWPVQLLQRWVLRAQAMQLLKVVFKALGNFKSRDRI